MSRHTRRLVLGAAAVLVLATPALVATTASAQSTKTHSQVMHLTVVPVSDMDTKTGFVSINNDFDAKGKQVGADVTTCRPAKGRTDTARCDVALGLAGGLITLRFLQPFDGNVAHGTVTGGTGTYAGVSGTVVIHEGKDSARATPTLTR